jgi:hypothetical protein
MRKGLTVSLLIFVALISTTFIAAYQGVKRVQAMTVRFNVKDLRERGLEIVGPLDPSFDNRVNTCVGSKRAKDLQNLKPFTMFLVNHGKTDLVAYVLRWEFVRTNGIATTTYNAYGQPGVLMGYEVKQTSPAGKKHIIAPGKARLFSPLAPIDSDSDEGTGMGGGTYAGEASDIDLSSRNYERIKSDLPRLANITVSVDGAFFADGTFVGPNNSHLFETIKAEIDAKRDLLALIGNAGTSEDALNQAWQSVQSISNTEPPVRRMDSTPNELYRIYAQEFARHMVGLSDYYGRNKASEYLVNLHKARKPTLKKD